MALELAQLDSRTAENPEQEIEPAKEDVEFEFNGNIHLVQGYPLIDILKPAYRREGHLRVRFREHR